MRIFSLEIDKPITIIISLFLSVVLTFFFAYPKYKEFKSFQLQLSQIEAEYNAKYEYYAKVKTVYAELQEKKDNIARLENAIWSENSYGPLMYFFQQKAVENGLVARNLYLTKTAPINSESDIKSISFSLDLLGSYSAFKNFLLALERSARVFDVTNVSFSSSILATTGSALTTISSTGSASQTQSQQTFPFTIEVKTHSY